MTAMTGGSGCLHGNSSPRATLAQQGKSCCPGVPAPRWVLEGKSKTDGMWNASAQKSDHNRAKTIPWIICEGHGAQGSSEREEPKFRY